MIPRTTKKNLSAAVGIPLTLLAIVVLSKLLDFRIK